MYDDMGCITTLNLDYRSLYLYFECGLYIEIVKCLADVKKDMLWIMSKSKEQTEEDLKPSFLKGMLQALLRLITPLM